MQCKKCNDTGVIETGNNDLPCDCPEGATALFNVAGVVGYVTGAEIMREFANESPKSIGTDKDPIPTPSLPIAPGWGAVASMTTKDFNNIALFLKTLNDSDLGTHSYVKLSCAPHGMMSVDLVVRDHAVFLLTSSLRDGMLRRWKNDFTTKLFPES